MIRIVMVSNIVHESPAHASRCNNVVSKTFYGYGYRLCADCRPTVDIILNRADQMTAELVGQIEDNCLQFDPPVDIRLTSDLVTSGTVKPK